MLAGCACHMRLHTGSCPLAEHAGACAAQLHSEAAGKTGPGVQMEFEDVLPFHDFSFRVPQHMIYMLPQLLHKLVEEEADQVPRCSAAGYAL